MLIHNRIENVVKAIVFFQMADIFYTARREIVEDGYGVAAREQSFGEMGTNESSAASYKISQDRTSLG
jgi:hypothetical protein